ncbi:MAG: acyl-CoA dehydrogenase [Deltaproteobacteria bacterium HGW-Deltaproteobacteria-21]|nr:MAG: acyl-CoA dehydrogenase [Deltaproteobacteria bacterium HGW-Deltaproteobacteria-21]
MEILKYGEEHRKFRERLRGFFDKEVIPHADEWERSGMVPRSLWRRMGEEGFLCMHVGREYGGAGADFLYSVIVTEELARTRQTGLAAPLHSDVVVPYIASFGSEELKRKYLPGCVSGEIVTAIAMTEPDAGSDLVSMRTSAVQDGDWIVLNGEKIFISNGIHCDLLVIAARDASVEDPYRGIDLYLVEAGTVGFEKGKRLSKMGWHSQDTAELLFRDCRIPNTNRLGSKGGGFLMLMEKLQQERLMCSIIAVAAAENILSTTMAFCREKRDFGRVISRSQEVQFRLVEMATEVRLGRTFVDKLIADHMEGKAIVVEASMAKYWTTDMVMRVADRSLELHGNYGCCEEYPVARAWRDARVMSIFAGTNEIMKGIAAKFMGL